MFDELVVDDVVDGDIVYCHVFVCGWETEEFFGVLVVVLYVGDYCVVVGVLCEDFVVEV